MELGSFSTSITTTKNKNLDRSDEILEEIPHLLTAKCDVTALFTSSFDLPSIVGMLQDTLYTDDEGNALPMPGHTIEIKEESQYLEDGVKKEMTKPVLCSSFLLKLPWHTDAHVKEAISDTQLDEVKIHSLIPLTLEGGIAFGSMAEHPTTRLCLSFLHDLYLTKTKTSPQLILDYGAGSGILGLAACKLGAKQAIGVEMDLDAIQIANANAKRNSCNMLTYLPNMDSITNRPSDDGTNENSIEGEHKKEDRESLSVSMVGSVSRSKTFNVDEIPENLNTQIYDLCMANILPKALMTLAPIIARMVKPGKEIALSGIRDHQAQEIIDLYSEYFDDCKVNREEEGWVLISGIRKTDT